MDIEKINDNYTFYDGYEDEPEVILSLPNCEAIHIWEGYFDDIYDTPSLDGKGWSGFTRDYHQLEGIFSNDGQTAEIDPKEYLDDLMLYKNKAFDYEETTGVFDLLIDFFEKAIKSGVFVKAQKV